MVNWQEFWDKKSEKNDFESMGRSSSSFKELFIYIDSICRALGDISKNDVILDLGGGKGYISMALSPFVEYTVLIDFSNKMVERAISETSSFKNIDVFQDSLPKLKNVRGKSLIFTKIIVGSVLQYLDNYDEIKTSFYNLYNVLEDGGKLFITHNPDLSKKESFLNSYNKLDWTKEKIAAAIEFEENERFWIDYNILEKEAKSVGFSKCLSLEIPSLLFQSTHMFDLLLIK